MENLASKTLDVLEAIAYVHDIGIKVANELYGFYNGKLQEELGSDAAKLLLEKVGLEADLVERVMYIIWHYHTYDNIVGLDYQILVEADRRNIFKTETGIKMLDLFFCEE